jgi:hypothetical protein
MIKKLMPIIIIALVFIFPFRWAFLEYPKPNNVAGTMVDSGRIEYVTYFILTLAGVLIFLFMSIKDEAVKSTQKGH